MSNGLKIISAEITNFKGLSHKEIDFGGRSMMVVGPNDHQKSSLIQAIMCAMDKSYKPLEPLKRGEERGSVIVTLGGTAHGKETSYTVEMYFSPDNQKGRLVLLDSEGKKVPSPASSLDMIIGNIGFDIDAFIALSKTKSGGESKEGAMKQVEILKGFLPKEIRKELFDLDVEIKEIKDQRTEINREIKNLTELSKHSYSDEELTLYSDPKPIDVIQEKIKNIGEASQNYAKAETAKRDRIKIIEDIEKAAYIMSLETSKHNFDAVTNCIDSLTDVNNQRVVAFKVHLAKFKTELSDNITLLESLPAEKLNLEKIEKWFTKNVKPNSDALMTELNEANTHNKEHDKIVALKKMREDLIAKQKQYDSLAEKIDSIVLRKKEIFAGNPLPVKKLSFDEEQVLYDGLPFNDQQLPSSTIIGVGVRIAMAMNPNLKVIVIKDGSLLDKKTANGILKMIEKDGYQLFIEMVDWNGKETEIRFIEKEITF